MNFALLPLSRRRLELLAALQEPDDLVTRAEPGALPPPFVAARALRVDDEAHQSDSPTSFLIVRTADARLVGSCGFKTVPRTGQVEVGYGVAAAARCTGAATAALEMLTAMAFEAGASEVLAEVLPENIASTRVVQKAGF